MELLCIGSDFFRSSAEGLPHSLIKVGLHVYLLRENNTASSLVVNSDLREKSNVNI